MSAERSFIEILEDEIRTDIRREIEAELLARESGAQVTASARLANTAASGRFEAWLASHVAPVTVKVKAKAYGTRVATPATRPVAIAAPAAPFAACAKTSAEIVAVELLNRHSAVRLGETFTEDQLKTAWRKAAMKSHPDRFVGENPITVLRMTALFRELSEAYELLCTLFDGAPAASRAA